MIKRSLSKWDNNAYFMQGKNAIIFNLPITIYEHKTTPKYTKLITIYSTHVYSYLFLK